MSLIHTARTVIEHLPFGSIALHKYRACLRRVEKRKLRQQKAAFVPDPVNRKINIGGGNWYRPYWENLDLYADSDYIDHHLDIRSMAAFPVADGTAAIVFTSHCLEHLPDDVVAHTLKEVFRILKPSGVLRIIVPDLEKAFCAYKNKDLVFFMSDEISLTGDSLERRFVNFFASYKYNGYSGGPLISPEEVADHFQHLDNNGFVSWCVSLIPNAAPYKAHVNGFDFDKLKTMLTQSGFSNVVKSGYKQSSLAELKEDRFDNRPTISLYVEAIK